MHFITRVTKALYGEQTEHFYPSYYSVIIFSSCELLIKWSQRVELENLISLIHKQIIQFLWTEKFITKIWLFTKVENAVQVISNMLWHIKKLFLVIKIQFK